MQIAGDDVKLLNVEVLEGIGATFRNNAGMRLHRILIDGLKDEIAATGAGQYQGGFWERVRGLVIRNSLVRGGRIEAMARFSYGGGGAFDWNEDILIELSELYSQDNNDQFNDKPSVLFQIARKALVRRCRMFGMTAVGVLAHDPLHKDFWNEDIEWSDNDFAAYTNHAGGTEWCNVRIETGSRNVRVMNNHFHDCGGKPSDGQGLINCGGGADQHGSRATENVTVAGNTGTLGVRGNPFFAEWNLRGALLIEGNEMTLGANAVAAPSIGPPIKLAKMLPGWAIRNNKLPLMGQPFAAVIAGKTYKPADFNRLPDCGGNTFA